MVVAWLLEDAPMKAKNKSVKITDLTTRLLEELNGTPYRCESNLSGFLIQPLERGLVPAPELGFRGPRLPNPNRRIRHRGTYDGRSAGYSTYSHDR